MMWSKCYRWNTLPLLGGNNHFLISWRVLINLNCLFQGTDGPLLQMCLNNIFINRHFVIFHWSNTAVCTFLTHPVGCFWCREFTCRNEDDYLNRFLTDAIEISLIHDQFVFKLKTSKTDPFGVGADITINKMIYLNYKYKYLVLEVSLRNGSLTYFSFILFTVILKQGHFLQKLSLTSKKTASNLSCL